MYPTQLLSQNKYVHILAESFIPTTAIPNFDVLNLEDFIRSQVLMVKENC